MPAHRWTARSPKLRLRGLGRFPRPDVLPLEARILPAVFNVTTTADVVSSTDGVLSLREAIIAANALGGVSSTINLQALNYTLTLDGAGEDGAATGDLDITAPIVIAGAGMNQTRITGDGTDRVFDIRSSAMITIKDLTVTGGVANVGGGILSAAGSTLELDNLALVGNTATGDGGGLAAISTSPIGRVNVNNVLVQNNAAGGFGGGMLLDGITAIVNGMTVADNVAGSGGGGADVRDTANTHLAGAQVTRATFSGNSTGGQGGAALTQAGIVRATDTTITLNTAAAGGGLANTGATLGGGNNIVAGNTAPTGPDILGPYNSQGFNLIGDGSAAEGTPLSTDIVGSAANPINPQLASLALRGGSLPVHVPGPGSPALNKGSAFSTTDERGDTRPTTGADIGAVEARAFGITSPSNGQHAAGGTAFNPALKAVVTEGGQGLPGISVTFTAPAGGASGTFVDAPTPVTDANGVATAPAFTANFTTGTYSVQANAGGNVVVPISLTNDAAATDTLQLTGAPASVASGTPFQVTLTVLKPDGTRDFGFGGTVSFSTDAAASDVNGQVYTFNPDLDGGQKTFTFTINSAGSHFVKVSAPGLPSTQVSVNVIGNQFAITAPGAVDGGVPFSITVASQDPGGNPISFVGQATITSDDPQFVPTNVTFTAADNGTIQVNGLVLRQPGPRTITVTAADGSAVGSATVTVNDTAPSALALSTDLPSIKEGDSIQLTGAFADPDPSDPHTVVIKWGDGTSTTLPLAAGTFNFQTSHKYTDDPPGLNDNYKIDVTVTDAAGKSTTNSTSVTVTNVKPTLPASGGIAIGDQDTPLGQTISFFDPGADTFTATATFGDAPPDAPPENIPVGPSQSFVLNHIYKTEGTFDISVTLTDDDGGQATFSERVVVFLPGTTGVKILVVQPHTSGSLTIDGATVTLTNNDNQPEVLLLAPVNLSALHGLKGSPTDDPSLLTNAYDIRVLDAGPDSTLTAQLTYPNGQPGSDPLVQFYDKVGGEFDAVAGSTKDPNSFSVDKANRRVTFLLGDTSHPLVSELGGTVFTLSVPAPTTPTNNQSAAASGTSPFLLTATTTADQAVAGIGDAASFGGPIPTTGLVSNSTLTVAVSAAEGLRRGGGDETPAGRLVTPQTLSNFIEAAKELRDFVVEAFRMWTDEPPPMEAPAAVLPPPDAIDRVHLREVIVSEEAAAKYADAAPPEPLQYEAVTAPPPAVAGDDVVIATAEERPWWLKPYEIRKEPSASDQIPIPSADPSESDRSAAAVAAVWLGGSTLAAVVEPPAAEEDEEEWPLPESEADGEQD